MEKIDAAMKKLFDGKRRIYEDEYLKDGLIYCKNCHTPRQTRYEEDEETIFPTRCKCETARWEAEEKARQQAEWENKVAQLRRDGIPNPSYRAYTFAADDGKTPKTTAVCKSYVENFEKLRTAGGGLILYGSVGTGKSFFAMCIANALIDKGYAVQCTSLATVVKLAQDFDNADDHFDRLMRKPLLVIDDLGTERGTTFAQEQIYKFIDGCYTYNIPLVITTNYTPKLLTDAAEDTSDVTYARIYSRILERCLPVKVNDIKRRAAKGQAYKSEMAELLGLKAE
ncbi:MAG: ATP-binding protein [Firmicutes bacterium]|nr:ATP-binding protein [Bacillota bacterium]